MKRRVVTIKAWSTPCVLSSGSVVLPRQTFLDGTSQYIIKASQQTPAWTRVTITFDDPRPARKPRAKGRRVAK